MARSHFEYRYFHMLTDIYFTLSNSGQSSRDVDKNTSDSQCKTRRKGLKKGSDFPRAAPAPFELGPQDSDCEGNYILDCISFLPLCYAAESGEDFLLEEKRMHGTHGRNQVDLFNARDITSDKSTSRSVQLKVYLHLIFSTTR